MRARFAKRKGEKIETDPEKIIQNQKAKHKRITAELERKIGLLERDKKSVDDQRDELAEQLLGLQ